MTPTPPAKLTNPHRETCGEDNDTLVQARLSTEVFNYFFRRGVLTGDRGPRQALICTFFQKLYEQCQSDGIVPAWDPDNESRVAAILARLNFIDIASLIQQGNRSGKSDPNLNVAGPERPVRTGRADSRSPKSPGQPASTDRKRRSAARPGPKTPHDGDVSADVSSQTQQ